MTRKLALCPRRSWSFLRPPCWSMKANGRVQTVSLLRSSRSLKTPVPPPLLRFAFRALTPVSCRRSSVSLERRDSRLKSPVTLVLCRLASRSRCIFSSAARSPLTPGRPLRQSDSRLKSPDKSSSLPPALDSARCRSASPAHPPRLARSPSTSPRPSLPFCPDARSRRSRGHAPSSAPRLAPTPDPSMRISCSVPPALTPSSPLPPTRRSPRSPLIPVQFRTSSTRRGSPPSSRTSPHTAPHPMHRSSRRLVMCEKSCPRDPDALVLSMTSFSSFPHRARYMETKSPH
mmetsp:Transcript_23241/g.52400  ORF Transcript_23241/g.52400 Transcript_23241/m.52400 type:complete len:288 (-) Transcript_23241:532-1395(-)